MHKKVLWLCMILLPAISQAQFDNILKKTKNKIDSKVENRVDSKIDKEIDKKLDEIEGREPAPIIKKS